MPIVSIAGNPTIVKFSISTHHITVIRHNKMTNSKRTSESERTPLIQRMKGTHNRMEICCLCVKMGRLLTMGNTVYSLSQGQGLSLWEKARSSRSSSSSDDADTSPPRRHVTKVRIFVGGFVDAFLIATHGEASIPWEMNDTANWSRASPSSSPLFLSSLPPSAWVPPTTLSPETMISTSPDPKISSSPLPTLQKRT